MEHSSIHLCFTSQVGAAAQTDPLTQGIEQGCLTRATRAHDGHHLTRPHIATLIKQDLLVVLPIPLMDRLLWQAFL